jgi:hypothetical protein
MPYADESEFMASFLGDIDSYDYSSPLYSETSSDIKPTTSESMSKDSYQAEITYRNPEALNLSRPFSIIRKDGKKSEVLLKQSKKVKKEPVVKPFNYKQVVKNFSKYTDLEAVLSDPRVDGKTKKKIDLMMRNRISAQLSRDRKKAHMSVIEVENVELRRQNEKLMQELKALQDQNQVLIQDKVQIQNQFPAPSNNCPCSALKEEKEAEECLLDEDWTMKDFETGNLTRIFQRRPSFSFMGYSMVLMAMVAMLYIHNNKPDQYQKYKSIETNAYSYKYQMEIENFNNMGVLDGKRSVLPITTQISAKTACDSTSKYQTVAENNCVDLSMKIENLENQVHLKSAETKQNNLSHTHIYENWPKKGL